MKNLPVCADAEDCFEANMSRFFTGRWPASRLEAVFDGDPASLARDIVSLRQYSTTGWRSLRSFRHEG